jgi:hypothetical protein
MGKNALDFAYRLKSRCGVTLLNRSEPQTFHIF